MSVLTEEYLALYDKYKGNPEQALICLQYAKFYSDSLSEKQDLQNRIDFIKQNSNVKIPKTAFVIISYNAKEVMIQCINSIRNNNPSDLYEIIVVDNHSEDGIESWLSTQSDILLISNKTNKGFTAACNQGIEQASMDSDIFLLNNDTILYKNSLFFLLMGLYENDKIGAVGSVSNNIVGYQQIDEKFTTMQEYENYALVHNVYMDNAYEKKCWLVGYAMLIKRVALNKTGNLDERFSPGNFEDNDISIRLLQKGYQLLLCKNSFIYHYGSLSFKKNHQVFDNLLKENHQKFIEKYRGIDYVSYSRRNSDLLLQVKENRNQIFSLLEINCGLGADLAYLETIYPKAHLKGIERNKDVAELANKVADVMWKTRDEYMDDELDDELDYVLANATENELTSSLDQIYNMLRPGGKLVLGVENNLLFSRLSNNKDFINSYENSRKCVQILNENFTANSVIQLLIEHNFSIMDMNFLRDRNVILENHQKEYLQDIWQDFNETYFTTKKYIVVAIKK